MNECLWKPGVNTTHMWVPSTGENTLCLCQLPRKGTSTIDHISMSQGSTPGDPAQSPRASQMPFGSTVNPSTFRKQTWWAALWDKTNDCILKFKWPWHSFPLSENHIGHAGDMSGGQRKVLCLQVVAGAGTGLLSLYSNCCVSHRHHEHLPLNIFPKKKMSLQRWLCEKLAKVAHCISFSISMRVSVTSHTEQYQWKRRCWHLGVHNHAKGTCSTHSLTTGWKSEIKVYRFEITKRKANQLFLCLYLYLILNICAYIMTILIYGTWNTVWVYMCEEWPKLHCIGMEYIAVVPSNWLMAYPENFVAKLAHFDVFRGHLKETLLTAGLQASVTAAGMRALLLTYHSGVLGAEGKP